MQAEEKTQVLLLGLEDGLLWQLTKALAAAGDRLEVHVARDFSVAGEMCKNQIFDVIVVDGWEQSWQAGYALGWDKVSEMRPRSWVVLVESVPVPGLLDEEYSSSAVFLEKPFNPKEFPSFLLNLSAGPGDYGMRLATFEEKRAGAALTCAGHFLVSGERYRPPTSAAEPAPDLVVAGSEFPGPVEVSADPLVAVADLGVAGEPPSGTSGGRPESLPAAAAEIPESSSAAPDMSEGDQRSASGADSLKTISTTLPVATAATEASEMPLESTDSGFESLIESGFACLRKKDYAGARAHWERASVLRPDDKRLQANLRRLEKLAG